MKEVLCPVHPVHKTRPLPHSVNNMFAKVGFQALQRWQHQPPWPSLTPKLKGHLSACLRSQARPSHHGAFSQLSHSLSFFLKDFIYLFLERGEGRERERERNINVWLPLACHLLRTRPATQACVLTGNPTSDPLVRRPALNPLNHTSQVSHSLKQLGHPRLQYPAKLSFRMEGQIKCFPD